MQQNTISNNTFTSSVKDISQGNIESRYAIINLWKRIESKNKN